MAAGFEEASELQKRAARRRGWWLLILLLGKFPLFLLAAVLSYRLGGPGPAYFGIGVVLVYCALIGRVVSQTRS